MTDTEQRMGETPISSTSRDYRCRGCGYTAKGLILDQAYDNYDCPLCSDYTLFEFELQPEVGSESK